MYAMYGDIYHQNTPNVSIYTIHGSYGLYTYIYIYESMGLKMGYISKWSINNGE